MRNIYFISDIHLAFRESEYEKAKRARLTDFLDFVRADDEASALYLVGDIFDFWFEWYHVVPRYWFPIFYKLRQLLEKGLDVVFITGNHDFFIGKYMQEEIGIRCFDESTQLEVAGKRFFIAHGDGLAKEDGGYRFMKRIIRNPLSIFLFKTFLPADWGMQLAKAASHSSRTLIKIEKPTWAEEYFNYARSKFSEGFDYVIMGHTHFPLQREENGKVYVNTGDWVSAYTYALFDGVNLELKKWQQHQ